MKLSDLREFADLAETRNFGLTADRMFISQSSLSKHISRIERELDASLFDRSQQPIMLTATGQRFLSQVYLILRRYDTVLRDIRSDAKNLHGTLRIGYLDAAAHHVICGSIHTFVSNYPGIKLQFYPGKLGELERDAQEGKLDVCITVQFSNSVLPKNMRFSELYRDSVAAVVPRHSALADRQYISFAELLEYPFVMPSSRQYPDLHNLLNASARAHGSDINIIHECSDISSSLILVESGEYVSALPLHVAQIFNGPCFINLTDEEMLLQVGAMWRTDSCAPGVEQFVNCLMDYLGSNAPQACCETFPDLGLVM